MKYSTQRRIHVMILSGRLSPFPVGVRSVEDRTQDQKPFSGLANSSKKGKLSHKIEKWCVYLRFLLC